MKVGLLTIALGDRPRAEAFEYCASIGLGAVELGTGEFTANSHVGEAPMDGDEAAIAELADDAAKHGLEISALSCHGNPLHPDERLATRCDDTFRRSVRLAQALGVGSIVVFSGCPGTPDGSSYPNWITTPWPNYFRDLSEWQWRERVIPYWSEAAEFAGQHGVGLAFEMHPGNSVYNTESLLRLREACGESIGANFDPSHLWWQGMDPLVSLQALAEHDAIFHVHAKDTIINPAEMARDGGLTVKKWDAPDRPWRFVSVGYGHDQLFWRQFVVALRMAGYDGVLSIEHEDPLAPVEAPLVRTANLLNDAIWAEPAAELNWYPPDNYASPLAAQEAQ